MLRLLASLRRRSQHLACLLAVLVMGLAPNRNSLAQAPPPTRQQLVFLDTDVGDDIDDAFALALLLQSPELHLLGISTTFGDTTLRARLLTRLLAETGHTGIPIAAGPPTPAPSSFTQRAFAERSPATGVRTDGVALLLDAARAHPHQVTLIALGPLTTVEAAIDRDPTTFRLFKAVVLMGGSIRRGYGSPYTDLAQTQAPAPDPEWNIRNGIAGAQKLLATGVPLTVYPLDSTRLPFDEVRRATLFTHGSSLTDALTLLYTEWGQTTPILFDPLVVASLLDPTLCPTTPFHLRVDDKGYTREEPGNPNAQVCLTSNRERFLDLLLTRLLAPTH